MIFPLAIVAALVVAVLILHTKASDDSFAIAPSSVSRNVRPDISHEPRSAASMLAQEPLHSLLAQDNRLFSERAEYLAALDTAHRAEPVDPLWASRAEQALVDVSQGDALAATRITPDAWLLRCRSRSCKMTAVFGDHDNAQDWANFFLTGTGDILAQAELSVRLDADGSTHVLILGAGR